MGKIKNSAYSPQLNNNHNNTYTLSLINRCDNSYSSKINHKKYSHNVIFLIMLIIFLVTVHHTLLLMQRLKVSNYGL